MITIDEKTVAFFRFVDLRVYDKALDYSKWVISQLQHSRNEGEQHAFSAFFKNANEIALNIAEGSSRNVLQFEYYLKLSKSAIRECMTYTELCYKLESFNDEQRKQSHELLMELMRMTGALIVSLSRSRHQYDDRHNHEDGEERRHHDHNEGFDDMDRNREENHYTY